MCYLDILDLVAVSIDPHTYFKFLFFLYVEEMIKGLTQVPWERVDVSFQKSNQRYIAHSTIQVSLIS